MDILEIIRVTESILELEEERERTAEDEFDAFHEGEISRFGRTRAVIDREQTKLGELKELLLAEDDQLDELIDSTEFLRTDQATRHREQAIAKLTAHNTCLTDFHTHMTTALELIEANLDAIEQGSTPTESQAIEDNLEQARESIETHNTEIAGLDKNLTILSAYLR